MIRPNRLPNPKDQSNKEEDCWFGAERGHHGERAITNQLKTLRSLQLDGFDLREIFATRGAAVKWLNNPVRPPRRHVEVDVNADSEVVQFSDIRSSTVESRSPSASGRQRSDKPSPPPTTPSTKIALNNNELFTAETAGDDPSVGNKEQIYNIAFDNIDEMDIALCPPHMTSDERENFLETVVDVTALPGMFRSTEGGDVSMDTDTATSIVATALGKRAAKTDVMWQVPARNALSKVKTQEQLYNIISGIERSGRIAFKQQEGRMRAIMYKCNYDKNSITLYLQAGLLPRMMRASHAGYIALLYKARQKVLEHGSWEDSLGYEMIMHHASETMNLRHYSVDWRSFVIQTYIYLRDTEKKSYVDETMYETLFKRIRLNSGVDSSTNKSRDRVPGNDTASICSHCRCPIGKAHPGGKASCVFATLPYAKAKDAGRQLLSAMEENPRLNKANKIKELVEEFGGGGK